MENIKPVSILPKEEIRIIKLITIISNPRENIYSNENPNSYPLGQIVYERELTENYKFSKITHNKKNIEQYSEYPTQDSFPHDEIDNFIIQSIKNSHPKSTLKNLCLFTNDEKENLNKILYTTEYQSTITFLPDLSQLNFNELTEQIFYSLKKKCTIHAKNRSFDFTGYYNLDDKDILGKINKIVFI